jgi:alkylglycerol monooxygenase
MFGTFQEEIEEPAYGLCPPAKSWNILRGQLDHYIHIFRRFRRQQGIANKLSVLFKGPGWVPGGTRLGDISKVPNIDWSKPKYGPEVPTYLNCYVAFHFAITVLISFFLLTNRFYSYILHICVTLFMVLSLQAFSAIYDQREYAYALEFTRLIVFLVSELVCWAIYKDDFRSYI